MRKKPFYIFLSAACVAGYIWLAGLCLGIIPSGGAYSICLFKQITNIPCPSCGSTRTVLSLIHGDIHSVLTWNPMGIVIALILTLAPLWIVYDGVMQKVTLFNFFTAAELTLKRKWIAIPAIILVLMNWLWNIHKGL